MRRSPWYSLNQCTVVREDVQEHVEPRQQTISARRRRSLWRGAARWHRDTVADGRRITRVLEVGLTVVDLEPDSASGAITRLMERIKDRHRSAQLAAGKPTGSGAARSTLLRTKYFAALAPKPVGDSRTPIVLESALDQVAASPQRLKRDGNALQRLPEVGEFVSSIVVDGERFGGPPVGVVPVGAPGVDSAPFDEVLGQKGCTPTVGRARKPRRLDRHTANLPNKALSGQIERMRYFWWAEFQRRGAIHYHMMLVDVPFADEAHAKKWLTDNWTAADGARLAGIQTFTKYRSAAWFRDAGADYVMKDARKGHRKAYEQEYSRMPRLWRTFRNNQLAFTAREHQEHETKAHTMCTAAPDVPWHERMHHIWVYRVDTHVPQEGGCRLTQRRPARRGRSTRVETRDNHLSCSPGTLVKTQDAFTSDAPPVDFLHVGPPAAAPQQFPTQHAAVSPPVYPTGSR